MIKIIEMDKTRDAKRGASRFSRQTKQPGLNSDYVSSEKLKGERIKRLSAVNRASSEEEEEKREKMRRDVSYRDEEQLPSDPSSTSSNRFKLPRKFLDDCNGVDHTSVPRKLRSAMKKQNCHSLSPPSLDSKKLNHTSGRVESPKRDGVKKLKLRQKGPGWSQKRCVCGPITKDEEEVVETLYTLAGLFPDNELNNGTKLDRASLDENHSVLAEANDGCPPPLEDSATIKEDSNSFCFSRTPEDVNPTTTVQRLPEETVDVNSLNEPSIQESLELPASKKIHVGEDGSVAQMDPQTMLAKHEERKPFCNTTDFYVPAELFQDTSKLKQSTKLETTLPGRKPEMSLGLTIAGSQVDQQHMSHGSEKNGSTLWPCLSSTVSSAAWSHGPSSQCSPAKVPVWLDTALDATRPNSFRYGSSTGKVQGNCNLVSEVTTDERSWKRCAAHVYISHLIQALPMPESEDGLPQHPNQLRLHEILKQGVFTTANDFDGTESGLNGVKSARSIVNDAEKNMNKTINGILPLQRLHHDQPQAALASGVHTSLKRSFNFLSLSPGGRGFETNASFSGSGNGLEPLAQLQVPYLHSHVQHPTLMPYSTSQTYCTSSSYPDQPSASAAQQAELQLPPYLGHPFNGPRTNPTTLAKQKHQQQLLLQQQQQRLWAVQMAVQYRAAGTSMGMAHFPSWHSGMQDSPTLIPCAQQAGIPSSPSSLDVLGLKYPQISSHQPHQQQHLTVTSSLPHAWVKKQDHHLSSVYEETGGGFHRAGAVPLRLLCNERL